MNKPSKDGRSSFDYALSDTVAILFMLGAGFAATCALVVGTSGVLGV